MTSFGLDEDITRKDPKYKRYCQNIDRALAWIDNSTLQEWADYISFLARLLKALQSHPALPLIPSKHLVAKRLAQCLNARLPSGVHQKTIEVYSYIFSRIGREGLASDLALWTPGLTPVLSYASLTLKPHYLELLEKFYTPLGKSLRPALLSLILALLPGIDEEGGEYFDQTLALLDAIRSGVEDDTYFWQCFLLATIKSPGRRQGALAYLGRKLPTLQRSDGTENDSDEVKAVMDPEPGLLVRAFCAGLADEQLLVQRGFLELLVTHMPLASNVLQQKVSKTDLQLLVLSAASVVLRREMSLNRRLWSWFLGPEEQHHRTYFEKYGKDALVKGLQEQFDQGEVPGARARPYRICLSLMDRWDIGSLVVPDLFRPAIDSLRTYEATLENRDAYAEVLKSANAFFDGVEARLIWAQILDGISTAFEKEDAREIQFVRFIMRTFNVREEEMREVHAPLAFLAIMQHLKRESKPVSAEVLDTSFPLLAELLDLIPSSIYAKHASTDTETPLEGSVLDTIHDFYKSSANAPTNSSFPIQLPIDKVSLWMLQDISSFARDALSSPSTDSTVRFRLLVEVIRKLPKLDWDIDPLMVSFMQALQSRPVPFAHLQGMFNVAIVILSKGYLNTGRTNSLVQPLVEALWDYLSPAMPKYHVESIKALWSLQGVLGDRRIESALATVIRSGQGTDSTTEHCRRFTVLWRHSVENVPSTSALHMVLARLLYLVLDCLGEEQHDVECVIFVREWLQNLPSINRVFSIFVTTLLGSQFAFLRDPGARNSDGAPIKRPVFDSDDCLSIAMYYFDALTRALRCARITAPTGSPAILASETVIGNDEQRRQAFVERGYGEHDMTLQVFLVSTAIRAMDGDAPAGDAETARQVSKLHRSSLELLLQLLPTPSAISKNLAEMELENTIGARLVSLLPTRESYVQVYLLQVLYATLELSLVRPTSELGHLQQVRRENNQHKNSSRISLDLEKMTTIQPMPPQRLLRCITAGFSSDSSKPVLTSWVDFLTKCLPLLTDVMFQVLIPLVDCLCSEVRKTFEGLKSMFSTPQSTALKITSPHSPETILVVLLDGLEQVLATAHGKLHREENSISSAKSPDAGSSTGGFFGNMVSGVFSVESPQNRGTANNRLTVLLCFKDAVKLCYNLWSWGDVHATSSQALDSASKESWGYTSLRLRGKARRILEHMFAAETLECLETLVEVWPGVNMGYRTTGSIFRLINALDGSQPKHTVPTIFNALYSRTNPTALDPAGRSTLTAELSDLDIVVFLVEYAKSLEPDVMDEIWTDCMTFLKDVLANPFPHRQILPMLLSFTAILGEKVDGTNFGDQRRMRKELGDFFLRTLTASLTMTPVGQKILEPPAPSFGSTEKESFNGPQRSDSNRAKPAPKTSTAADDVAAVLGPIIPDLPKVLVDPERVTSASTIISTNLIGPLFRAKSFPQNTPASVLDLTYRLTRLANNQKAWRKELSEALLDSRFFTTSPALVTPYWIPLTQQYLLTDRERMPELLQRLTPPTQSGFILGVGATSARQEADRKAQLNLRRIAFLVFAAEPDAHVVHLRELEEKMVELLAATPATSPSSATRAEVFMVFRALALRTQPVHLGRFWPVVNAELYAALAAFRADEGGVYEDRAILQACKLLDILIVTAPDEFQLNQWLFVTDTGEAVYHPLDWDPAALVDRLTMDAPASAAEAGVQGRRPPWFRGREDMGEVRDVRRELIAPFLSNVSIAAYEGTYAMEKPDVGSCEKDLVEDLFEEGR